MLPLPGWFWFLHVHSECLEQCDGRWKTLQDHERHNINVVVFLLLFLIYFVLRSRAASFCSVNCLQYGQSLFCTLSERTIHHYFGSIPQKRASLLSREESGLIPDCLSATLFLPFHPFCPLLNIASLLLEVGDAVVLVLSPNFLSKSCHSPFLQAVRSQAR